ncbi:MmcQ/YjbR family DNA-binding protein [Streptomyces sp. JJ36]|uniref:MmcQ/YjbR family DNA-binding protein n=1 Tax=Streptomyces sp. JJ36 TaxID=2736645 RepID=UPI001F1617A1|nr:MmcQ/YjbR family DNA-binding protein [Streptomyces sp. JJ36]MCF6525210.1 MmcQ/YjbR family DNA-binding protein [Streptomyces sp. JJ36]
MTAEGTPPAARPSAAARTREDVRAFALALPGAVEEFPWGDDAVAKVNRKIFVFLGAETGDHPIGVTVKLTDPEVHEHALTFPGAAPAGYGLGRSGWVSLPLERRGAPGAELLCDWVEESYRAIAPKRLVARLDADGPAGAAG